MEDSLGFHPRIRTVRCGSRRFGGLSPSGGTTQLTSKQASGRLGSVQPSRRRPEAIRDQYSYLAYTPIRLQRN